MTRRARYAVASAALIALLGWLVVYPLALVAADAVRGPAGPTLDFVRAFAGRRNEWQALWGSVWISLASVAAAALIGVPLAFLFERVDFPGRRILATAVALPAVLPPLVGTVAFIFLFGETGFLARLVGTALRLDQAPWRLQGPGAILLVHAYSMYVYFYLFTRVGLAAVDGAAYEAAASLGASRGRTLVRVVLPLLAPALAGAALLVFMTSLASFSAPYLFGGGFRVMTTQIVATRLNGDIALAMVETAALTLVALAALILLPRGAGGEGPTGKGVAPAPAAPRSRWVRRAVATTAWLAAALALLPHLTLLVVSFVPLGTWTTEAVPPAWTLRNYVTLVHDPVRLRPLLNSLWMALAATAVSLAIGLVAAVLAVRRRAPGRRWIEALVALPWAVPGTVFAIALATMLSVNAPALGRVVLVGTIWILPLSYVVRTLPLTGRALLAGFRGLDPSLEEAAATLGAGRRRTLARITLPLLRRSLVAGATLAFVTALGDFVTSIVLYTYDTRPISLEILGSLRQSDVGVAAAYGVVLMLISAAVFALGAERRAEGG